MHRLTDVGQRKIQPRLSILKFVCETALRGQLSLPPLGLFQAPRLLFRLPYSHAMQKKYVPHTHGNTPSSCLLGGLEAKTFLSTRRLLFLNAFNFSLR